MCGAVGLVPRDEAPLPDDVRIEVEALDAARAARDFEVADAVRAGLQARGWVVETTKQGTTVRPA
jgi:cysteinyl-tRNA synthetase